ncbi:MAG: polysaccharide deacetylase family protein [Chloroflexi bacterium]|nr:polysaccharide deacetylase family protein [Chloroflexota bacterium]
MRLLHDWEYTTITIEALVKAIQEGITLPPRPIMITFDDGNLDNYTNAFPVMQKYGFNGTLYVVGTYIGAPQYMNVEQIKEVARAGWEIGSHGMTHPDLEKLDLQTQNYEIVDSRWYLENKLGLPILTFAYPFGVSSCGVNNIVYKAGYIAGMSIGATPDQCKSELYNLHRFVVKGVYGLNRFASLLPWWGDLFFLPTETPAPVNTPVPAQ